MKKHVHIAALVALRAWSAGPAMAGPPGNCCHQQRCDNIPDIDQCFPALHGTVVPDCSMCVPRGQDCWSTTCGETRYDFCETPIPADFFGPGSLPFEGTVYFQNDPLAMPSTIMTRPQETFMNPGECRTIPIELEQLSLVSCQPIVVQGAPPTQWNVQVQNLGSPAGQMQICKTHSRGGTFDSQFFVQPVFTFTNLSNPSDVRVFNTQLEGIPPTQFQSSRPGNWSSIPPFPCDPNTDLCCTLGFWPGHDAAPGPGCSTSLVCCTPIGHQGPGHIHETKPPLCVPCECGACCLPHHACAEVVQDQPNGFSAAQVCVNLGGTYMGAGTDCSDTDGDALADVLESNGCCGPKDNCHTGTDPADPDTNDDGINDGAQLAAGEDPCAQIIVDPDPPQPNPFGTCTGNNAVCTIGGPACANGTCEACGQDRYISFKVPAASPGANTAYRVKLTSLYHPNPIPPQGAMPNFSGPEGNYRYLDVVPGALSRCCVPNPTGTGSSTCTNAVSSCNSDADCAGQGAHTKCEKQMCPDSAAFLTYFRCARLGCNPVYRDWASDSSSTYLFVFGDSVVPDSTYQVAILQASCAGNETTCGALSPELSIKTERWGNLDCSGSGMSGIIPNAQDCGFLVNKLKDLPGAFIEPRCQLQPATPAPLMVAVSALDCGRIIDAVKGFAYPAGFGMASCPGDN